NNGIIAQSWKLDSSTAQSSQSESEPDVIRDKIRKLIANGKIQDAIIVLFSFKETESEASIIMGKFKDHQRDVRLGLISDSEAKMQRVRIADAILQLGDQLE